MADKLSLPRLLLTRPKPGSERFLAALSARGLPIKDAVVSPAMKVVNTGDIVELPPNGAAIFTSRHAIPRARAARGTPAYCVGEATADEARRFGFSPITAGGTADDLLNMLLRDPPTAPLVYCHGRHVRREILGPLRKAGITVTGHVVYDQPACKPTSAAQSLLAGKETVLLPLFSPRTAEIVAHWVADAAAPIQPILLSEGVALAWKTSSNVAAKPTMAAMVDAVAASYPIQGNG
ncbi:MAG: uroporphyrinogen-III synthase [Pseudomonadota bacterium]